MISSARFHPTVSTQGPRRTIQALAVNEGVGTDIAADHTGAHIGVGTTIRPARVTKSVILVTALSG